jgi:hypothetical protein
MSLAIAWVEATWPARGLLGLGALAALSLWLRRSRAVLAPSPLKISARASLGPRCGAALVEARGVTYLVVHGEGFAELRPLEEAR